MRRNSPRWRWPETGLTRYSADVTNRIPPAPDAATAPPPERRWPPVMLLGRAGGVHLRVDPAQVMSIVTLSLVTLGSAVGVWWFWTHGLTWFDVALLVAMKFVTGLGITLGLHRLFSHKAFEAVPALRAALGILGAMTAQGQTTMWCSIHRKHHRYSDLPGDPHSPLPIGPGLAGALRGFVHGHVGWIVSGNFCTYVDYVRDLRRDPVVAWVDRWYWLWVPLGWIIPGLIGAAWYGSWAGYWSGLFAGGALRTFFQLNFTWAVNSLAHWYGRRPFATRDDSRNNPLVNALTMNGEGLHNNHHAFPWSAKFALFRGEIDPAWYVLRAFERLGWARNIRVPAPRLIAARAAHALPDPAAAVRSAGD